MTALEYVMIPSVDVDTFAVNCCLLTLYCCVMFGCLWLLMEVHPYLAQSASLVVAHSKFWSYFLLSLDNSSPNCAKIFTKSTLDLADKLLLLSVGGHPLTATDNQTLHIMSNNSQ